MCNNLCERFQKIYYGNSYYCQKCAKFINEKYLKKEKGMGRRRCSLLYTTPSPRDAPVYRMPSSA